MRALRFTDWCWWRQQKKSEKKTRSCDNKSSFISQLNLHEIHPETSERKQAGAEVFVFAKIRRIIHRKFETKNENDLE